MSAGKGHWAQAGPEVVIGAVALAACSAGAFVLAGTRAVVVVVVVGAVFVLGVLSRLLPAAPGPPAAPELVEGRRHSTSWFHSYWKLRARVKEATIDRASYESGLRPRLEHLLAARLSERHGVNLYRQPEQARRLLCAREADDDLWPWVDPAAGAPPPADGKPKRAEGAGIPPRTLSRLVQRLEQL